VKNLWEFPQFVLGQIYLKKIKTKNSDRFRNIWIHRASELKDFGISFGRHIILSNDKRGSQLLRHEIGHSIQSLILGPFFLLIVGIPSLLRYRIFLSKESKAPNKKEHWINYQRGYPENWANWCSRRKGK